MDGHDDTRGHARAADFTVLPGVGEAIDRRLHAAGVDSYRDLAGDDADRLLELLAGIPSLSRDRIADWIVGAARLARKTETGTEPAAATDDCCDAEEVTGLDEERIARAVEGAPTFEGFTLRVVTAPDAAVARVHLQHVRTGGMRHAADLDELPRMITDLLTDPDPASTQTAPAGSPTVPVHPAVHPAAEPGAGASQRPLALGIELRPARVVVREGEPFSVEIRCKHQAADHLAGSGRYTASVYARPLGGRRVAAVVQGSGVLDRRSAIVVLSSTALEAGSYQLEALVELTYSDGSGASAFDDTMLVVSPRA